MTTSDFINDLARSIGFLSRMRVPDRYFVGHGGDFGRTCRAFPLAGVAIALPPAALFALLLLFHMPSLTAAFIALAASALITGCLHEDGLSDTADGIGGGRDRDRMLAIMRDSRIGTYGATALILSFGIRASVLAALGATLTPVSAAAALLGVAAISRAAMVWHWFLLPAARTDGVAAHAGQPDSQSMHFAVASGAAVAGLVFLFVFGLAAAVTVLAVTGAASWFLTRYIERRLGGHTGDTIGASQQSAEIACLCGLALWL